MVDDSMKRFILIIIHQNSPKDESLKEEEEQFQIIEVKTEKQDLNSLEKDVHSLETLLHDALTDTDVHTIQHNEKADENNGKDFGIDAVLQLDVAHQQLVGEVSRFVCAQGNFLFSLFLFKTTSLAEAKMLHTSVDTLKFKETILSRLREYSEIISSKF